MISMKGIKQIVVLLILFILTSCEESKPTSLGGGYIVDFNVRGAKLSILNSQKVLIVRSQVLGYGFDKVYYRITKAMG